MYITNWDEFQKAAEDLYIASPEQVNITRSFSTAISHLLQHQTRYVHNFHRSDGELVLKVTDDRTVKYR